MALRHTTYDPQAPSTGGIWLDSTVGDALNDLRDYFLGLGAATRWQEVTNAAPTPAAIQQYASVYTPGTNAGSMAAEDQQITFFLTGDEGDALSPPRYRLLRISKYNSTTSNLRLVVLVREVPGDASWSGYISTANTTGFYLVFTSGNRVQIIETDNVLSFWSLNNAGSSFESYNLVTYPDPPTDGHVLRDTPDVGFIYHSHDIDQFNSSQSTTTLTSRIIAERSGSPAYLFPAGGAHFGSNLDVQGRQMLVGIQVVRFESPVYSLGLLDEALAISGAVGGAPATFQIGGRGYVKTVHRYQTEGVLSILLPYE